MTAPARSVPRLTVLERQTLELVAQGVTYQQIGRQRGTSEIAPKNQMARVLRKLGAQSAAHAVLLACQAGLLDGRRQHHGDHNGYEAHIRRGDRGDEICDACRDGEKAYRAGLREARRTQEGPCAPVSATFSAPTDSGPSGPESASEAHGPANRPTNQTKAA